MLVLLFVLSFLQCAQSQGTPPTAELDQCTEAIWSSDNNSFTAEELTYNLAGSPLFENVNEARFTTGVYPYFIELINQFNPQLGQADPDLTAEINAFLDVLMPTPPMMTALDCLKYWGFTADEAEFRSQVLQYWFQKYSRSNGAELDSSGFENTFQGEISEDGASVTGFHGWIHTYFSEQSEEFVHGSSGTDCADNLVSVENFSYKSGQKSASSMWMGRSPEFEFAVYTVCFMTRQQQNCNFNINNGREVTVVNFRVDGLSPTTIGTMYPECEGGSGTPGPTDEPGGPPQSEIEQCAEEIWAADTNSFPPEEIQYNLAGPELFTYVNEERLQTGVYPFLITLLENYNPQIGEPDPDLDAEIDAYLDAVLATEPMQVAYTWINQWGYAADEAEFRTLMRQYWFLLFSRSGGAELDSSGFQHTFQGEIREGGGEATGFHGWVNFYMAEQNGELEYGSSQADCGDDLVQVNNFYYKGAEKPISSIWIGKSVELEFALYSMCFTVKKGSPCRITVDGGREMEIINYTMSGVSPTTIGTVYPNC